MPGSPRVRPRAVAVTGVGWRDRLRRGRPHPGALAARLEGGGEVVVACKLRRTSARGWGAWTDAVVTVGAVPGGGARWATDDAIAVGFASTNDRIDLPFEEVDDVVLRSVRFRTEAFWGMHNDIVVVASDRGTVELALPPGDADPLATRLAELLLRPTGAG
ncbi:MAG: hypothetical protein R2702_12220 [Acidimicrobiales bacterium]